MKKSYRKKPILIIELLMSFSEKEWDGFEQYLNCPLFNADKKLIILLQLLRKNIIRTNSNPQLLKIIHEKLFESQTKEKRDLTDRQKNSVQVKMSVLLKVAYAYLKVLAIQEDDNAGFVLLQQQLLNRKQFRLFEQAKNKWTKVKKHRAENVDFYENQFYMAQSMVDYFSIKNKKDLSQQIKNVKYNLNMFFLLNYLDYYLYEMSLSTISKQNQVSNQSLNLIMPLLNTSPYSEHPLLKVYQFVIELFENRTESTFLNLIKLLNQLGKEIPIESLVNFYYSLINFCVSKSYEGDQKYKRYQIDIYKIMDRKNLLLLKNKLIQIGDLRNMVLQSCRINEFDWANHIVNKYYKHIAKNIRDDVKAANLAIIAFYQNQYQQAIYYLFPLQSINQAYDINRRTIIMKSYYELDTDCLETTHTLFRSFEKYIREHKSLTSKSKTSYKNFIRTLINLYRIKHSVTKMQLDNLKQKLEAQKLNSNKTWLQEKIAELK